jgi:hypothetical protein
MICGIAVMLLMVGSRCMSPKWRAGHYGTACMFGMVAFHQGSAWGSYGVMHTMQPRVMQLCMHAAGTCGVSSNACHVLHCRMRARWSMWCGS